MSFLLQFDHSFDLPQQRPSRITCGHPVGYRYPESAVKVVRQPQVAAHFATASSRAITSLGEQFAKAGDAGFRAAGNTPIERETVTNNPVRIINQYPSFWRTPSAHGTITSGVL
jgi:hypothetical protein